METLAYIDLASGSLIFQAAVATIVAIPFFFRTQLARLARAVRRTNDPQRTETRGQEQPR